MNARLLVLCTFASVAVAAACSGASGTELFAPPGSSEFGSEPTTGGGNSGGSVTAPGGSGSGSSSGGSSSGGSSSGGSSSGGSSSGGSSSGGSSSGGTKDAGADAGWKSPGVYCGDDKNGNDLYCGAGSICCGRRFRNKLSLECVPNGIAACAAGAAIRCDDRTDCPGGQVCCWAFEQNSGYTSVECKATCTSPIPGVTSVRFCDPNAPVDECNEIGKDCEPSGSLAGFHVCK